MCVSPTQSAVFGPPGHTKMHTQRLIAGTFVQLRVPAMAHGAALRPGVSVVKEIVMASGLGLATASVWKARRPCWAALRARHSRMWSQPLARLERGGGGALGGEGNPSTRLCPAAARLCLRSSLTARLTFQMWHWNHMRRTETFYADLARSEAAKQ